MKCSLNLSALLSLNLCIHLLGCVNMKMEVVEISRNIFKRKDFLSRFPTLLGKTSVLDFRKHIAEEMSSSPSDAVVFTLSSTCNHQL